MSEFTLLNVLAVILHSEIALLGFAVIYMGYRLFRGGAYEKAGNLKAAWGEKRLSLMQVTPGFLFALCGTLIIISSVGRGVDTERKEQNVPDVVVSSFDALSRDSSGIASANVTTRKTPDSLGRTESKRAGKRMSQSSWGPSV